MLIIGSILLLLANAVTLRREKSKIFNRVAVLILLYSGILAYDILYIESLATGIGVFSGLFQPFNYLMSSILIYSPADEHKKEALKVNIKKSGVYKWTNLINGKSYVGSSVNLARRFSMYYSEKVLIKELDKMNSQIYRASPPPLWGGGVRGRLARAPPLENWVFKIWF